MRGGVKEKKTTAAEKRKTGITAVKDEEMVNKRTGYQDAATTNREGRDNAVERRTDPRLERKNERGEGEDKRTDTRLREEKGSDEVAPTGERRKGTMERRKDPRLERGEGQADMNGENELGACETTSNGSEQTEAEHEIEEDTEGFELPRNQRRRMQRRENLLQRREQTLGEENEEDTRSYRKFKVIPNEHFGTGFDIVDALAKEYPHLKIKVRPNLKRQVIITALDDEAADKLTAIKKLSGKEVQLQALNPEERVKKWVVLRYPLGLDPGYLTQHEKVLEAVRCTIKDRVLGTEVETRQVFIKAEGLSPNDVIDIGWFGRYKIRIFTPDPIRCFRCQRFGHHQRTCTKTFVCAICAGNYDTGVCIQKKKDTNIPSEVKCPNCKRSHAAWSLACPVRKGIITERIDEQRQRHTTTWQGRQQEEGAYQQNPVSPDDITEFPQPQFSSQRQQTATLHDRQNTIPSQKKRTLKAEAATQTENSPDTTPWVTKTTKIVSATKDSETLITMTSKGLKSLLKGLIMFLNPQTDSYIAETQIDSLIQNNLRSESKVTMASKNQEQQQDIATDFRKEEEEEIETEDEDVDIEEEEGAVGGDVVKIGTGKDKHQNERLPFPEDARQTRSMVGKEVDQCLQQVEPKSHKQHGKY